MRRAVLLAALAVCVVGVAGAEAQPASDFPYGIAAGEVTSSSAILWTRAPRSGRVELLLSTSESMRLGLVYTALAREANDWTINKRVPLVPDTRYWYRFEQGRARSEVGTFRSAPAPNVYARVRFAITGDADATPAENGEPAYNRYEVYGRMAGSLNEFNINLGDTIYSDSGVANRPVARTVAQKRAKYRLGLALPALRKLRASAGLYSHWDDHEFVNDFARPEHGGTIYRAGVRAFRDYSPVSYTSRLGLYRSVRWGRNLELFFLDERSFRSAKATQACGGDLAPTVPQPVRDAFATLAPALRNPVPPACLAALTDPARTMLGARQYETFTKAIRASTAVWKVVVNQVPIQQYYALPYDRWEGYAAERERLLRFLQATVRNVVFLTTDTHANLVNEIRYTTLGGAPESSGIWEVVTGPVATNTFAKEIDGFLGSPGAGTAIGALFFKPPPPQGMGMRCAALDVYSYAQVTVTRRALIVAPRDAQGMPVREPTGVKCTPLVLRPR